MTRLELLELLVGQARVNGFEFRRWYMTRLGLPWISTDAALRLLDAQRRYYALLFSHEFASHFWKAGTEITFEVPPQTFRRRMVDGSVSTVQRKSFIRRSTRPDAWRYHLREMALADEPLRYMRKYLRVEEELDPEPPAASPPADVVADAPETGSAPPTVTKKAAVKKPVSPRPLPSEPPAFLKRPYPGPAQDS